MKPDVFIKSAGHLRCQYMVMDFNTERELSPLVKTVCEAERWCEERGLSWCRHDAWILNRDTGVPDCLNLRDICVFYKPVPNGGVKALVHYRGERLVNIYTHWETGRKFFLVAPLQECSKGCEVSSWEEALAHPSCAWALRSVEVRK